MIRKRKKERKRYCLITYENLQTIEIATRQHNINKYSLSFFPFLLFFRGFFFLLHENFLSHSLSLSLSLSYSCRRLTLRLRHIHTHSYSRKKKRKKERTNNLWSLQGSVHVLEMGSFQIRTIYLKILSFLFYLLKNKKTKDSLTLSS